MLKDEIKKQTYEAELNTTSMAIKTESTLPENKTDFQKTELTTVDNLSLKSNLEGNKMFKDNSNICTPLSTICDHGLLKTEEACEYKVRTSPRPNELKGFENEENTQSAMSHSRSDSESPSSIPRAQPRTSPSRSTASAAASRVLRRYSRSRVAAQPYNKSACTHGANDNTASRTTGNKTFHDTYIEDIATPTCKDYSKSENTTTASSRDCPIAARTYCQQYLKQEIEQAKMLLTLEVLKGNPMQFLESYAVIKNSVQPIYLVTSNKKGYFITIQFYEFGTAKGCSPKLYEAKDMAAREMIYKLRDSIDMMLLRQYHDQRNTYSERENEDSSFKIHGKYTHLDYHDFNNEDFSTSLEISEPNKKTRVVKKLAKPPVSWQLENKKLQLNPLPTSSPDKKECCNHEDNKAYYAKKDNDGSIVRKCDESLIPETLSSISVYPTNNNNNNNNNGEPHTFQETLSLSIIEKELDELPISKETITNKHMEPITSEIPQKEPLVPDHLSRPKKDYTQPLPSLKLHVLSSSGDFSVNNKSKFNIRNETPPWED